MRVNLVVPPLNRTKFSGGIYSIMQYADGLARRGHEVNVIPIEPSSEPTWFSGAYTIVCRPLPARGLAWLRSCGPALAHLAKLLLPTADQTKLKSSLRRMVGDAALLLDPRLLPLELRRAVSLLYLREAVPEADATIATSFETALPARLHGSHRKFYFLQHYEAYFKEEYNNADLAEIDAHLSYHLGLRMIANSTWLKRKVETEVTGAHVELCPNAIDHGLFYSKGKPAGSDNHGEVLVISYGGRNAVWKGFSEMAEAMRIVCKALPSVNIRWQVFGDALLPANNGIAPYEHLGFLKPVQLADAYRNADILLSASWYESFPAFPLEAMACGLAVITTQCGTEDYAIHGETAEIVEARNPESIAEGLIRLIKDDEYRQRIALNGCAISKEFTWAKSVSRMEEIISG